MVVATTYSRAEIGIEAPPVTVEADVLGGLPQIQIVGLPETAVKESKDRVKSAIKNDPTLKAKALNDLEFSKYATQVAQALN